MADAPLLCRPLLFMPRMHTCMHLAHTLLSPSFFSPTFPPLLPHRDEDFQSLIALGMKRPNEPGMCLSFEQALLYDALASAAVGRPLYYWAISACRPQNWNKTVDGWVGGSACSEVLQPLSSFPTCSARDAETHARMPCSQAPYFFETWAWQNPWIACPNPDTPYRP